MRQQIDDDQGELARFAMRLERPWTWVALSLIFVTLDYLSGPLIQFPITFIFPVGLAAWHGRTHWALALAVILPFSRFVAGFVWVSPLAEFVILINMVIRILILSSFGLLINKVSTQAKALRKRVKILEGILPICAFCKKIRDDKDNSWHQIESFITDRSEARFSHGFCPECGKKYYGEFYKGA